MYEINKDIRTETKIIAGLYLFDIIILGVGFGIAMLTNRLLPVGLRLPYMILVLLALGFFILPSKDNPGSRNYQSLVFALKRSKDPYHRENEIDVPSVDKPKRVPRSVFEKMSIKRMDNEGVFYRENDLFDLIEIKPLDLFALNQDQAENLVSEWHSFYLAFAGDLKYIIMRYPNDMYIQRQEIEHLLQSGPLSTHRQRVLEWKLEELNRLETKQAKEYYLMIFAENPELLRTHKKMIQGYLPGKAYQEISAEKKLAILKRLYNPIEG